MARTKTTAPTSEPVKPLPAGAHLITEADITRAEQDVATAVQALREAEAEIGRSAWRPGRNRELGRRRIDVEAAELHVEQLRRAMAEQQQVRDARPAAGQSAAGFVAESAKELQASADRTVEAIVAAEQALAAMIRAVDEHDQLIEQASRGLAGRGLLATDAFGEHDSGGTERHQGVRLAGEWWARVGSFPAAAHAVSSVARSVWGGANEMARLRYSVGAQQLAKRSDRIGRGLPDLGEAPRAYAGLKSAPIPTAALVSFTRNGKEIVRLPDGTEMDLWAYKKQMYEKGEADRRSLEDITY